MNKIIAQSLPTPLSIEQLRIKEREEEKRWFNSFDAAPNEYPKINPPTTPAKETSTKGPIKWI